MLSLLCGFQQRPVGAGEEGEEVWKQHIEEYITVIFVCLCCVVFSSGLSEPEEKEKKYEEKGVAEEDGLRNILNSDDEDEEEEENKEDEDNEDEEKKEDEKAVKEKSEDLFFRFLETMFLCCFSCLLAVQASVHFVNTGREYYHIMELEAKKII